MTKFQTERVDETMVLIKRDEDTLSGSICRAGDHWHVEILWGGPTGDIVYDAPSLQLALAFIDGVEKAFEAMEGYAFTPTTLAGIQTPPPHPKKK